MISAFQSKDRFWKKIVQSDNVDSIAKPLGLVCCLNAHRWFVGKAENIQGNWDKVNEGWGVKKCLYSYSENDNKLG